ncbi:hypothetical protein HDU98_002320 [Podochytrium sp. JEL0797]|nr:hypothetical protein HDU98_002320 [Podochytrium sp. JEL0797]
MSIFRKQTVAAPTDTPSELTLSEEQEADHQIDPESNTAALGLELDPADVLTDRARGWNELVSRLKHHFARLADAEKAQVKSLTANHKEWSKPTPLRDIAFGENSTIPVLANLFKSDIRVLISKHAAVHESLDKHTVPALESINHNLKKKLATLDKEQKENENDFLHFFCIMKEARLEILVTDLQQVVAAQQATIEAQQKTIDIQAQQLRSSVATGPSVGLCPTAQRSWAGDHHQRWLLTLMNAAQAQKHSATFDDLSVDVVPLILCWLSPKQVHRYRRVSRAWNVVISTPLMALRNLDIHLTDKTPIQYHCHPVNEFEHDLFTHMLESYIAVYFHLRMSGVKVLKWDAQEDDSRRLEQHLFPNVALSDMTGYDALIETTDAIEYEGGLWSFYPRDVVWKHVPKDLQYLGFYVEGGLDIEALCHCVPLLKYLYVESTWNDMQTVTPFSVAVTELISLQSLTLIGVRLGGEIPASLGQLVGLRVLNLRDNLLTGPIPRALENLVLITRLDLSHNKLSGGVPDFFPPSLKKLDLGFNALTGPIPRALENLVLLTRLALSNNKLGGGVPDFLPPSLKDLDLRSNALTGPIPRALENLVVLTRLDLSKNKLGGGVPDFLPPSLKTLSLCSNDLGGTIPRELGRLVRLRLLFLTDNRLSGTVPQELVELANLTHVNLKYNKGLVKQTRLRRWVGRDFYM